MPPLYCVAEESFVCGYFSFVIIWARSKFGQPSYNDGGLGFRNRIFAYCVTWGVDLHVGSGYFGVASLCIVI